MMNSLQSQPKQIVSMQSAVQNSPHLLTVIFKSFNTMCTCSNKITYFCHMTDLKIQLKSQLQRKNSIIYLRKLHTFNAIHLYDALYL